ncbi:MAG TPA: hypothetical protein VKI19_16285, partial [Acidimicrobiales bacterium]|nr:hypothetical protein [Acidimicrobiales bacterium]
IEGTAETRDGRLSWADVVLLHPATYGVPGLDTAAAVACIESAPLPAAMWEVLRLMAARADAGAPFPPARLAAWMDAGMFARATLQRFLPLDALLEVVRPALQPSAYRRLVHVARALQARGGGEAGCDTAGIRERVGGSG